MLGPFTFLCFVLLLYALFYLFFQFCFLNGLKKYKWKSRVNIYWNNTSFSTRHACTHLYVLIVFVILVHAVVTVLLLVRFFPHPSFPPLLFGLHLISCFFPLLTLSHFRRRRSVVHIFNGFLPPSSTVDFLIPFYLPFVKRHFPLLFSFPSDHLVTLFPPIFFSFLFFILSSFAFFLPLSVFLDLTFWF